MKKNFDENILKDLFIPDVGKAYNVTHATTILAWYSAPNKKVKKVVELGCATGAVSAYLAKNYKVEVHAIEKEQHLTKLAMETAAKNNLLDRMHVYNISCSEVRSVLPCEKFDLVVANPPHHLSNVPSSDELRKTIRSGDFSTVDEFLDATFYLLRNRGYFVYVISPEYSMLWLQKFLERNLQPKILVPVYGEQSRSAVLLVVKGVKNGGIGLKIEPPLVLKKQLV